MFAQIFGIIVLLAFSAFFSSSETAYTSLSHIRLKNQASLGDESAKRALDLADQYDVLLSCILIGNNIVNIGAASLATVLFVEALGSNGVAISTAVLTLLTLIFGETMPKTIAKEYPEAFAKLFVRPLHLFMLIFKPLTYFFARLKVVVFLFLGKKKAGGLTEEELITLIDEVESEGSLEAHEGELIRSAIEFDDLKVREIYTPRVKITGVVYGADSREISHIFGESGFSRLPVYVDNLDNIIGILHLKDFYNANLVDNYPLVEILKPPLFTPLNTKLSKLMTILKHNQSHMAVLRDEYGGTVGIVTLEDILEELVGEIWDEHDEISKDLIQVDEKTYLVLGETDIERVLLPLGIEEKYLDTIEALTLSGFVMDYLGHIPKENESFIFENLRFTVVEATKTYVEKVKIECLTKQVKDET